MMPRIALLLLISYFEVSNGFSVTPRSNGVKTVTLTVMRAIQDESENTNDTNTATKKSLEEKMKDWESTEEEIREKSLGGLYVGRKTDGFDAGIVVALSVVVGAGALFAVYSGVAGHN